MQVKSLEHTNPGSSSFVPFLLLAEVPEDQEEVEQAKNTHQIVNFTAINY